MKIVRIKKNGANYRSLQRGASLLEGIAYLGIAAVVILGAVSLLTGAFGNAQANQAMEEIISLRTAARKLYAGQNYPPNGDMLQSMVPAGATPATLPRGQNNALTNTWGGAVTVVGNGGTFTVTYNNVPADVCVNLLSGANGWTQIVAGGAGGTTITAFPVPAATAAGACGAAQAIAFTAS